MKVRILFFAQLREQIGAGERYADLAEGTRAAEVAETFGLKGLPILFAVNERFVEPAHALRDLDTLAFLMPVSGGSV